MTAQVGIIKEIEKQLAPDGRVDTSLSVVFLKDDKAYKLKREMKNNFVDYSTLKKRQEFCEREFAINKRNSPALYNGVVAVFRNGDGVLKLAAGAGNCDRPPEEYLVEMNRFDEDQLLSRLARKNTLTEEIGRCVAGKVALMHNGASVVGTADYSNKFLQVVNIIVRQFLDSTCGVIPAAAQPDITEKLLAAFCGCREVLKKRGAMGFIRECHGDLHLGNICLFQGAPSVFDAVEFNTEFTHIDTLYDLAFLHMDLCHHGLAWLAVKIADRYLEDTRTDRKDFAALMPLYLGLRTTIRCSILAASVKGSRSEAAAEELKTESLKYYRETLSFLP